MTDKESWQFNKSVVECNKYMLEQGIACDVTFIVSNNLTGSGTVANVEGGGSSGEGDNTPQTPAVKKFHAHKYVMISRSPVFYAMLCGDMAEKGDIIVEDVEPDAFEQMLKYMYTDGLELNPESVMYIMYAAKKYLLPGLTARCAEFLQQQVDETNVCTILDQSLAFDEPDLVEKCIKIIQYKTDACFSVESFMDIKQQTLSQILESKQFTIPEVQVVNACFQWAKHECEKANIEPNGINCRKVLGECVMKLHFPAMNIRDFGTIISKSEILTWEQECRIFRYLSNPAENPSPPGFNTENRLKRGPWEIVLPFENVTTKSSSNIEYTIRVTTNKDIVLKGVIIGKFLGRYIQEYGTVTNRLCLVNIDDNNEPYELAPTTPTAKLQYVHLKEEKLLMRGEHQLVLVYSTNNHCTSGIQLINSNVVYLKDHLVEIKLQTAGYKSMPMFGLRFDFPI